MILRHVRACSLTAAALLAVACSGGSGGLGPVNADPRAAEISTADVVNFWDAWYAGGKDGAIAPFEREYLDQASPGLREFAGLRSVTATSLAQMVTRYPRYFYGVRGTMLELAANEMFEIHIRADYAELKTLYPEAVFPPLTFLVGRFSTAGTTGSTGILVGTEFYAAGPDTPLDELDPFQRANVHGPDSLRFVVAHEVVHIQQDRANPRASRGTLLEQSLREGSADFVGELVSGGNINGWIHLWALPREAEVWADFETQMNGNDVTRWLSNQGSATADRPGDLGYFVGYRIAQAYYERHADKQAALRAIIQQRDAAALLRESGYDPR